MTFRIAFSGLCFWTLEAIFANVIRTRNVEPVYVRHGNTKIEAVQFDLPKSMLPDLIDLHAASHDPSANDWETGWFPPCYSGVFCFTEECLNAATLESSRMKHGTRILKISKNEIIPIPKDKHGFFQSEPQNGYCTSQIEPKLERLRDNFPSLFKQQMDTGERYV